MGEGSSPNRKIAFCLSCVHHHSLVISAVSAKAAPRSLRSKFCKYSSPCPWISTNILIIGETSPERNIYNSQLPTVAHSTKMQNSLGLNINLLSQSWKWWMGMSYLVNSKSCLKSCMILSQTPDLFVAKSFSSKTKDGSVWNMTYGCLRN